MLQRGKCCKLRQLLLAFDFCCSSISIPNKRRVPLKKVAWVSDLSWMCQNLSICQAVTLGTRVSNYPPPHTSTQVARTEEMNSVNDLQMITCSNVVLRRGCALVNTNLPRLVPLTREGGTLWYIVGRHFLWLFGSVPIREAIHLHVHATISCLSVFVKTRENANIRIFLTGMERANWWRSLAKWSM